MFRVVNKIITQLDIDPTELRGIGIQINKLENRSVKEKTGCIENFLSNMKSKYELINNQVSFNKNTYKDKIILTKIGESKIKNSSVNAEIKSVENSNKPKTVLNYFKPKDGNSGYTQQLTTSQSSSNIPHPSIVNIKMSQVDPSFLDALPADLRKEIENELKNNELHNSVTSENESESMELTMTEESSKLYQHVHVDKMKEFIEEWVVTENEPKICDNIMVSKYLCNLVKDNKTEDAYEVIRKLYQ